MRFAPALALALASSVAFAESAAPSAPPKFPDGFKWCVATAAYQIEGGDKASDFWNWETYQRTAYSWDPISLCIDRKNCPNSSDLTLNPAHPWEFLAPGAKYAPGQDFAVPSRVASHLTEINPADAPPPQPSAGGAMASGGDPCPISDTAQALEVERPSSQCIGDDGQPDPSITADQIENCRGRIETDHTVKFPLVVGGKPIGKYAVCEFSGVAVGHWDQIEKAWAQSLTETGPHVPTPETNDIDLMKKLGATTYRMSVEWAKMEPTAPSTVPTIDEKTGAVSDTGVYDDAVIAHYQHEIALLRKNGIEPLVTLFHFSLPEWFREKGGWDLRFNPDAPKYFAAFTKKVYQAIGGDVTYWFTLNEPMVHLSAGYAAGVHPPGVSLDGGSSSKIEPVRLARHVTELADALKGILASHAEAYHVLHNSWNSLPAEQRDPTKPNAWPQPQVGVASHLRIEDPAPVPAVGPAPAKPQGGGDWLQQIKEQGAYLKAQAAYGAAVVDHDAKVAANKHLAEIVDYAWNWMFINALETGELKLPDLPLGETIPNLKQTEDYAGVNYYSRDIIEAGAASALVMPGRPTNDLGWEIYPEGFMRILRQLNQVVIADRGHNLPVLVSENGVADRWEYAKDAEADPTDKMRTQFLKDHLAYMLRAIHPQKGDTGELDQTDKPAIPVPVIGYCHWALTGNFEWNSGFNPDFGLSEVDMRMTTPNPQDSQGKQVANPSYLHRQLRPSASVFAQDAANNSLNP